MHDDHTLNVVRARTNRSLPLKKSKLKIEKIILLTIGIGIIGCRANPDNLKTERNFLKGIELSKELNKPIFLHFTGYSCVGYNEFYNDLITSRKIQERLNKEFITIELYVDDKGEIEISDTLNLHKIKFSEDGIERIKKSKTIGNINAAIQIDWLKSNSQPTYLIIDAERNILVEPFGYTKRNRKYFLTKLDEGLKEFKKRK